MSKELYRKFDTEFCEKNSKIEGRKELQGKMDFIKSMINPECLGEYDKFNKGLMDLVYKYPNSLKDINVQEKIDSSNEIITQKLGNEAVAANNRNYRGIILDHTKAL